MKVREDIVLVKFWSPEVYSNWDRLMLEVFFEGKYTKNDITPFLREFKHLTDGLKIVSEDELSPYEEGRDYSLTPKNQIQEGLDKLRKGRL